MVTTPEEKNEKGTYALVLALDEETTLAIGKLGLFAFPPGHYLYVGSALRGLRSRIGRHLLTGKSPRWHIDYLRQRGKMVEVWYAASPARLECAWYETASHMPGAYCPVVGFGSSDCHCPSHLVYFAFSLPSFRDFRDKLGEQGANLRRFRLEESRIGNAAGG